MVVALRSVIRKGALVFWKSTECVGLLLCEHPAAISWNRICCETHASVPLSNTIACKVVLVFPRFNGHLMGLSEQNALDNLVACGPIQATAVKLGRHRQKIRYSKDGEKE
jgi:hypothetical protein